MIKKGLFFSFGFACFISCLVPFYGQGKNGMRTNVHEKMKLLRTISNAYKQNWLQLGKSLTEVEKLGKEAHRAILSNAGVVMFKGIANTLQKYFDPPSASGLLQDLLQETLIDTEVSPKARVHFEFWTKQNLLRQKRLRNSYRLLERVMKAPLDRFDNDRGPFPHAQDIWPESDGETDSTLEKITRRLNTIIHVSRHLRKLIIQEREGLLSERKSVEEKIKVLRKQIKPSGSDSPFIKNGCFSEGLKHWQSGGGGYGGRPEAQKTIVPMATNGIARFGAYGGSCNITQLIDIPHTNLIFRARFQVVQWSTFNSGEPGGYAAVGISFLDSTEKSMATSLYYLNPHGPSQSRRGMHWIRLKPSKPLPTRWFDVVCDLRQELKYHQIRPDLVSKIVIMGIIFGTHEDKVASIGKFASFSLQTTQEQN